MNWDQLRLWVNDPDRTRAELQAAARGLGLATGGNVAQLRQRIHGRIGIEPVLWEEASWSPDQIAAPPVPPAPQDAEDERTTLVRDNWFTRVAAGTLAALVILLGGLVAGLWAYDQFVDDDDDGVVIANPDEDGEDNDPGNGTGTDKTSRPEDTEGNDNPPPVLHHFNDCAPEITSGCSFDVGIHQDQVGLAFGVDISWPEGGVSAQEGRCDLVVLDRNSWFENLHIVDGRFEVYTLGSDWSGWTENLVRQRIIEQREDYGCPDKDVDDVPVLTSGQESPPAEVGFGADTAASAATPAPQAQEPQAQQPQPQAPACDTVNCQPRRGPGRFEAGEAVYGFEISLDNGTVMRQCWTESAPTGGTVVDGVVNPWKDEVASAAHC